MRSWIQLALVGDPDHALRDELQEARHKRVELLLDTARDTVFDDEADTVLVLFRAHDGDVRTDRLALERALGAVRVCSIRGARRAGRTAPAEAGAAGRRRAR